MMRHLVRTGAAASRVLALPLALLLTLSGGLVSAADVAWDNDQGDFDYANPLNWVGDFLPAAELDDVALINNGDAVELNTSLTGQFERPAQLNINDGSLEIQSNGALQVVAGISEDPDVDVGGGGSLIIQSGGSLTASAPNSRGLLAGRTRLVGPTATFSAGSFALAGGHTLVAEITDSTTHSPLKTTGAADVNGALVLEFNGVNSMPGNSWTIVDAGNIINGFDSVEAPSLPLGQTVVVSTTAGGNGQLIAATIAEQLVLNVNVVSGEMSVTNFSTGADQVIDGYSVLAPSGVSILDPDGWTSFQDAGQAGWEEANAAPNHVGELNIGGSRSIGASTTIDLGNLLVPPTEFAAESEVEFEYHLAGGDTRTGAVNFVTRNNLVLRVDPSNGQTQLVNPSGFDVELDGYSVTSATSALDEAAWTSFQDGSQPGWEEANTASNHVGELNISGSRLLSKLEGNSPISLGPLFDFDKAGAEQDLVFTFHLAGGSVGGDYNDDGVVNAADYTVWRDNLGAPAGTLPNDIDDGVIDVDQYNTWRNNFGSEGGPGGTFTGIVEYVSLSGSLTVGSVPIPEPASGCLVAAALSAFVVVWRK